jgi:hypothetical protein
MRTRTIILLAAGVTLVAATPSLAQMNTGAGNARATSQAASDPAPYRYSSHCATNSGQRDPSCVVADTGSSTYRDSDAAGGIGTYP